MNKKTILSLIILLFVGLFLISCGGSEGKDSFETYSISEKGIITWNKINDAKYYYVDVHDDEDHWVTKTSFDISDYISGENGRNYFSVEAFTSKSLMGYLDVGGIEERVVKVNGKFYFEKDAPDA